MIPGLGTVSLLPQRDCFSEAGFIYLLRVGLRFLGIIRTGCYELCFEPIARWADVLKYGGEARLLGTKACPVGLPPMFRGL